MALDVGNVYGTDWWEELTDVEVHWKTVYLVCFLALALGFPAFYVTRGLHVDESLYLVLGGQIAAGSDLYVDVLDHKPPGIFYLAAGGAVLLEQPHVALRLLTYGVVALTGLLVLRLGTRLYGPSTGMTASLLYLVGSYLPHFDGFAFLTEQYVALCTVLAASLFLRRLSWRSDVGVGVVLGVGVLFNQAVFLFGGAVLLYVVAVVATATDDRRRVARSAVGRVLAIGAGFAALVGVALAYFAAKGHAVAMVRYALVVPLTEYHPPFDLMGHVWMTLSYFPVWLLALGGVLAVCRKLRRDRRIDRSLFVVLWALLLSYPGMTQFVGDHKLLYAFPPVALLAAATLRWLWLLAEFRPSAFVPPFERDIDRSQVAAVVLAVLAVSAVAAGGFNVVYGSMVLDESIENQRQTAAGVDEYADGQLYTFPFAFDLVYFGEGVRSPEMYVGGIYSPEFAERVIGTLEEKRVPYVAVHQNYVTADGEIVGSGYFANSETMVGEYITANYERVGESGEFVVYERTGDEAAADRDASAAAVASAVDSASPTVDSRHATVASDRSVAPQPSPAAVAPSV